VIRFLIRCAIAVGALLSLQYSSQFDHVDVSVPATCVADVSANAESGQNSCIYRDVSKRGRVVQRDFEVYSPRGAGFYTKNAMVVSRSNQTGFTWRTLALLLVAIAAWLPSLPSPFIRRDKGSIVT
jgi:hypothetical protein